MGSVTPPGRSKRAEAAGSALRREIEQGRFQGALALPGERQLAELLHVSRTTLRAALAELAGEGLLVQRQGLGTFITPGRRRPEPSAPGSPGSVVASGLAAVSGSRELGRALDRPTAEEAMMLAIGPTESVVRLSRVLFVDDEPAAIEHEAVPSEFLPDITFAETGAVAALEARSMRPLRTIQRLRVSPLGKSDADRLGSPPQGLAISVHTLFLLDDGRCCAFVHSLVRPDRFDALFETRSPR